MDKALSIRDLNAQFDLRMKSLYGGFKASIEAALNIGEILCKAKESLPYGKFGEWLSKKSEQYGLSKTTLYRWMEMHNRRSEFDFPKMGKITDAYRLIERIAVEPKPGTEEDSEVALDVSRYEEEIDVTQPDDPDLTFDYERDNIANFRNNAIVFSGLAKEVAPLFEGLRKGSEEWKSCVESVRTLHGDVKLLGEALRHSGADRAVPQL